MRMKSMISSNCLQIIFTREVTLKMKPQVKEKIYYQIEGILQTQSRDPIMKVIAIEPI